MTGFACFAGINFVMRHSLCSLNFTFSEAQAWFTFFGKTHSIETSILCRNLLCNVLLLRDSTSYTTWKTAILQSQALCGDFPASVLRRALVSLVQLGNVELGSLEELNLTNENILERIDALIQDERAPRKRVQENTKRQGMHRIPTAKKNT
jgi:hypothetical protein